MDRRAVRRRVDYSCFRYRLLCSIFEWGQRILYDLAVCLVYSRQSVPLRRLTGVARTRATSRIEADVLSPYFCRCPSTTSAITRNTPASVKCVAMRASGAPTTHPFSAKTAKPAAIAKYHQPYQRLRNSILLLGLAQIFYCTPSKVLRYYLQFPIELCFAIATR